MGRWVDKGCIRDGHVPVGMLDGEFAIANKLDSGLNLISQR
ncbi:MAG: hypothetical protein ACFBSF_09810 [Leptolyngbyaceae cyanobacterium]